MKRLVYSSSRLHNLLERIGEISRVFALQPTKNGVLSLGVM
jgi:hypothetical protein